MKIHPETAGQESLSLHITEGREHLERLWEDLGISSPFDPAKLHDQIRQVDLMYFTDIPDESGVYGGFDERIEWLLKHLEDEDPYGIYHQLPDHVLLRIDGDMRMNHYAGSFELLAYLSSMLKSKMSSDEAALIGTTVAGSILRKVYPEINLKMSHLGFLFAVQQREFYGLMETEWEMSEQMLSARDTNSSDLQEAYGSWLIDKLLEIGIKLPDADRELILSYNSGIPRQLEHLLSFSPTFKEGVFYRFLAEAIVINRMNQVAVASMIGNIITSSFRMGRDFSELLPAILIADGISATHIHHILSSIAITFEEMRRAGYNFPKKVGRLVDLVLRNVD